MASIATTNSSSYFGLIVAFTVFSLSGIFLKSIYGMPVGSVIYYRLIFGLLTLLVFMTLTGKLDELLITSKRKYIFLMGCTNTIMIYTYFTAIQHVGVSIAALLLYTAPVYVTILSPLLLKENITTRDTIALLLSAMGILIAIHPGGNFSPQAKEIYVLGIMLGLLSGISYALSTLNYRYLRDTYTSTALLFWPTVVSLVLLSPYASLVSPGILALNIEELILFGMIMTTFGSLLYYRSARYIKTQNLSVISLIEPVAGIFFGYLILHEQIFSYTLEGCACVLTGVALISTKHTTSSTERTISKYFNIEQYPLGHQQTLLHTFYRILCKGPLKNLKR
ncbi:MAG: EamA-like transporter family protein [Methanomethylovorans sp. PtaU1.Bin093]|uniref:DMT family transporter n=2 Tax=Methanomethylovorans TaxID=101191 RepID=UPI0009C8165C|nr:DMT family transporter [Methanomethylovorans sp. PtaU1.Bin093]OPY21977.1 MAG: EamA-like transporter family protein [Methanomethylovorans sp. PtaU1.Bin093]